MAEPVAEKAPGLPLSGIPPRWRLPHWRTWRWALAWAVVAMGLAAVTWTVRSAGWADGTAPGVLAAFALAAAAWCAGRAKAPALASIVIGLGQTVPAEDAPGGSFGQGLYTELRVFRALALQVQVGSGVFPFVSEEAIADALTRVMPIAIGLTDGTVTAVEALDPPAQMANGHERPLVYLSELRLLGQNVLDAAHAIDLDALRGYGRLGGFTAELAKTKLWCTARSDLSNDPIEPVTASFFEPFGGVHPDQLCPA